MLRPHYIWSEPLLQEFILVLLLLEDLREHVVSRGQLLPGRVALPERLVAFASERCNFRACDVALPSPLAQARPGVLKLLQEILVRIATADTPARGAPLRRGRLMPKVPCLLG